jgi:hypothetical protein
LTRKQDTVNSTEVDPMDCYKRLTCGAQSDYPRDCVYDTDTNHALVHAAPVFIWQQGFHVLIVRMPFLYFDPKLHLITMSECGCLWVGK